MKKFYFKIFTRTTKREPSPADQLIRIASDDWCAGLRSMWPECGRIPPVQDHWISPAEPHLPWRPHSSWAGQQHGGPLHIHALPADQLCWMLRGCRSRTAHTLRSRSDSTCQPCGLSDRRRSQRLHLTSSEGFATLYQSSTDYLTCLHLKIL